MKSKHYLLPLALVLLAQPIMAEEKQTELGKQMEIVGDVYKLTKRESDPQKGAALARQAQTELLKSFNATPALVAEMPDGPKKQAAMAQYRRMIGESLTLMCRLEEAFLAGDLNAVAQIRDRLTTLRNDSHEKFKPVE